MPFGGFIPRLPVLMVWTIVHFMVRTMVNDQMARTIYNAGCVLVNRFFGFFGFAEGAPALFSFVLFGGISIGRKKS